MSILAAAKEFAKANLRQLADECIREGSQRDFLPVCLPELERLLEQLAHSEVNRRQLAKAVVTDLSLEFTRQNA